MKAARKATCRWRGGTSREHETLADARPSAVASPTCAHDSDVKSYIGMPPSCTFNMLCGNPANTFRVSHRFADEVHGCPRDDWHGEQPSGRQALQAVAVPVLLHPQMPSLHSLPRWRLLWTAATFRCREGTALALPRTCLPPARCASRASTPAQHNNSHTKLQWVSQSR